MPKYYEWYKKDRMKCILIVGLYQFMLQGYDDGTWIMTISDDSGHFMTQAEYVLGLVTDVLPGDIDDLNIERK